MWTRALECFEKPQRLRAAVFHPLLRGLVIFQGIRLLDAKVGAPKVLLFRPDVDRLPIELPMRGQPSRIANAWSWTLDPQNEDVLLFADDGIFRIAVSAG